MLVGNYFNHGLYHGLIPIMNVPFLNSAPAPLMYVSRVRDIMHKDLFTLMQDLDNPAKRAQKLTGPNHNQIDVMDYADRSPITVFPHTTVARAYSILRKLGLRHLVVIERNGRVCGMVTRKDLMLYKLVDSHERELQLVVMLQRMVREKQARSGFKSKDAAVPV